MALSNWSIAIRLRLPPLPRDASHYLSRCYKLMKMKTRPHKRAETLPVTVLEAELAALRRDLRTTIRAYTARLETDLAESVAAVGAAKASETLSRARLDQIQELMTLVRKRKLKPERGRRKDLRKIDALIRDMHSVTHPGASPRSSA